ncbi:malto-oligosyltrehalose synthase [Streptomyces sp. NBC_00257]|uniref:malto-oligosyltrehalose synthase n=1 Tax=unclassified Streptomyces TaxID=2593676 RepID=UPI00224CAD8E|nr:MULTISPECIES: malto-oligosyltrehalose synthase [unclassified Streptomyces]WTB57545.1 malto-oligosyltrehalose synthase [Streptomyces sp. NBC_00826]WTH89573.1 malto-oligosyltrehalose synthase [Streptomyces sp. NBC_00825]WTH98300.1 malto-oligosyltrehalose synthase [Streptomyces sp. NBC_00822]MCX4863659.1 malto-oligosyltrehalose synthase [Streptomyces sp. NBC_00906]MCX4894897.1 malto-oligosyltrehalose synthase [Streptomyces sp. NBC_00892]
MTPTATYRLQLQPDFPFSAAGRAVPYLAALGVSHLHLSPVLEAVPGSRHGYDVVDHGRVRAELGGEQGLRELARTAREHGLGLIVDIVPNHMAAVPRHNRALWEVLREGPGSPYARWFDIDWAAGGGKVLLPVLGGPIGEEIGGLRVDGDVLRHGELVFPLRTGTADLPLPELLDAQHYRLGWWRLARTELNYRRFFTISELIGVRVEDPEVFAATHGKILELVRDGVVDGLRIDHPDGLAEPAAYLERLSAGTGGRWTVVEKILTGGEPLPADWAVAGTTGYDALHRVDGLFVDPMGAAELVGRYREYAGPAGDRGGHWTATVRRAAYRVVTHELAAETELLTRLAVRICAAGPALRDHAPWALHAAVRELLVRMPVYRPYVTAGGPCPETAEETLSDAVVRDAKAMFAVAQEASAVDVVRELALGRLGGGPERAAFCARFAQTASALRAKSVEDTAFYRYMPLISANEVGGDPGQPAVTPEEFHAFCARLARDWPGTGTVLTTHDTKRSADVRARVAVLTECPQSWSGLLTELERATPATAPDPQLAWQAWQTAVGCAKVPGGEMAGRLEPALLKAVREAGLFTGWTEPDPVYERAVTDFVAAGPAAGSGPVRETLERFASTLDPYVRANVLGAALVQLTMPGVPDLYQGTEREYVALVDPDNRRPFREPDGDAALGEKGELTAAALRLRRERPEVFGESGTYAPLGTRGPAAAHCLAFCRSGEVVTAVTRLSLRLAESGGWHDTELVLPDDGPWTDLLAPGREFAGGSVALAELFAGRPVALLSRAGRGAPADLG